VQYQYKTVNSFYRANFFFHLKKTFMKKAFLFLLLAVAIYSCADKVESAATDDTNSDSTQQMASKKGYEFADDKYTEMAKKTLQSLAMGDVDGFSAPYADTAIFRWSGGDSIRGKQAISDYWKNRRSTVIDSLSYSGEAWLPIHISEPMYEGQLKGNYALFWCMVNAKYKSGKTMKQRMHMVYHFNDNDQIDRVTQFLDRIPIMAAEK
jgi:ketosteroid isomerase-like protein